MGTLYRTPLRSQGSPFVRQDRGSRIRLPPLLPQGSPSGMAAPRSASIPSACREAPPAPPFSGIPGPGIPLQTFSPKGFPLRIFPADLQSQGISSQDFPSRPSIPRDSPSGIPPLGTLWRDSRSSPSILRDPHLRIFPAGIRCYRTPFQTLHPQEFPSRLSGHRDPCSEILIEPLLPQEFPLRDPFQPLHPQGSPSSPSILLTPHPPRPLWNSPPVPPSSGIPLQPLWISPPAPRVPSGHSSPFTPDIPQFSSVLQILSLQEFQASLPDPHPRLVSPHFQALSGHLHCLGSH